MHVRLGLGLPYCDFALGFALDSELDFYDLIYFSSVINQSISRKGLVKYATGNIQECL